MTRRQQLSRDEVRASREDWKLSTQGENTRMLHRPNASLHRTLEKLNSVLYKKQLLRQPVVSNDLLIGAIVR